MVFFRKLRKLFRRGSTTSMHPERRDTIHGVEGCPRERNFYSDSFQLKYVGCDLVHIPVLNSDEVVRVTDYIIRTGQKTNKWKITMTFTPQSIVITDMINQSGLAKFHFSEVGMLFAHPTNTKYIGLTIKDTFTSGFIFFLYKCSVNGFECENSEIKGSFGANYERYLEKKRQLSIYCDTNRSILQRCSREALPNYCDKLGMVPPNDVKLRNVMCQKSTEGTPSYYDKSRTLHPNDDKARNAQKHKQMSVPSSSLQHPSPLDSGIRQLQTVQASSSTAITPVATAATTTNVAAVNPITSALFDTPIAINMACTTSSTTTVWDSTATLSSSSSTLTAVSDLISSRSSSLSSLIRSLASSLQEDSIPNSPTLLRSSSLPVVNYLPSPHITELCRSHSCPNVRVITTLPTTQHMLEDVLSPLPCSPSAVVIDSLDSNTPVPGQSAWASDCLSITSDEGSAKDGGHLQPSASSVVHEDQRTGCAMAMPFSPKEELPQNSSCQEADISDEEDVDNSLTNHRYDGFSYLFTSSSNLTSQRATVTPSLPRPQSPHRNVQFDEEEYVPPHLRRKRVSEYIQYLIELINSSLKEGHDQEDNVSTDGGVTSDVDETQRF